MMGAWAGIVFVSLCKYRALGQELTFGLSISSFLQSGLMEANVDIAFSPASVDWIR